MLTLSNSVLILLVVVFVTVITAIHGCAFLKVLPIFRGGTQQVSLFQKCRNVRGASLNRNLSVSLYMAVRKYSLKSVIKMKSLFH